MWGGEPKIYLKGRMFSHTIRCVRLDDDLPGKQCDLRLGDDQSLKKLKFGKLDGYFGWKGMIICEYNIQHFINIS